MPPLRALSRNHRVAMKASPCDGGVVVQLEPTVVEAASWRLATLLVRRHPHLLIRREHPGGGLYDVLAVRDLGDPRSSAVMLNRLGRIHIQPAPGSPLDPPWPPMAWSDALATDPREVVRGIENAAGWGTAESMPESSERVLVYRVLSALATLQILSRPIDIQMGRVDTAGGGGPADAEWLRFFPSVRERIRNQRSWIDLDAHYDYWHAARGDRQLAFDVRTGDVWNGAGDHSNLMISYIRGGRSMDRLLAEILTQGVPR